MHAIGALVSKFLALGGGGEALANLFDLLGSLLEDVVDGGLLCEWVQEVAQLVEAPHALLATGTLSSQVLYLVPLPPFFRLFLALAILLVDSLRQRKDGGEKKKLVARRVESVSQAVWVRVVVTITRKRKSFAWGGWPQCAYGQRRRTHLARAVARLVVRRRVGRVPAGAVGLAAGKGIWEVSSLGPRHPFRLIPRLFSAMINGHGRSSGQLAHHAARAILIPTQHRCARSQQCR